MIGATAGGGWPVRQVFVEYDEVMNTSVLPALGSFTIFNNGNPYAPVAVAWGAPTFLQLTYVGEAGAGPGIVSLDVFDPNLRSASTGALAWAPETYDFNFV